MGPQSQNGSSGVVWPQWGGLAAVGSEGRALAVFRGAGIPGTWQGTAVGTAF